MNSSDRPQQRLFGWWTLTLLVVANMIGAGVFTTSGLAVADLRSPERVLLAWLVAGLIALCGAYCYGQLVRLMPESGGEYLFLARTLHPLAGYIAGWVSLIAGFTGAIAFAATAFESYLVPAATRPAWLPPDTVAIVAVLVSGLLHGGRPTLGAKLQNVAVLIKLVLILSFVAMFVNQVLGAPGSGAATGDSLSFDTLRSFATSLVWISLSYSGYNAAVYLAEEAKSPRETVPRALLWGTLAVTLLYLLLNACFLYAAPLETISGQQNVALVATQWLMGDQAARLVQALVCAALLTSVMSMLMAAPRVYAKMADDGLFPGFLRFKNDRPGYATAAQVMLAVLIIVVADLRDLLGYLGLTLSISTACTVTCLLIDPRGRTVFRSSMTIAFVAATLTLALVFSLSQPGQFVAAALTFAVGAGMYWLTPKGTR